MENLLTKRLRIKTMSEMLFASSNPKEAYKISKMLQDKKIRKIVQEFTQLILRKNLL